MRGAVDQWVNALPLLGCNAKGQGIKSWPFSFFYLVKLSLEASLLSPLTKACLVYLDAVQ